MRKALTRGNSMHSMHSKAGRRASRRRSSRLSNDLESAKQNADDDNSDDDQELTLTDIVGSCRIICRRCCKRVCRCSRQFGRTLRKVVYEGGLQTPTVKSIRAILRGDTRKRLQRWLANTWQTLWGVKAESHSAKEKRRQAVSFGAKTAGESSQGFGVHCFVIHNKGKFLDFYDIHKDQPLGSGASASVFTCTEKSTQVKRAVKIVPRGAHEMWRVAKEVAVMKSLDHPNIAKCFETFEAKNFMYLVLEHCSGGDLYDKLSRSGVMTEFNASVIMRAVLMALNYLNHEGFMHRDLKPENILFKDDRQDKFLSAVRLVDFGYACDLPAHGESLALRVGSPYYMAPEVLEGSYDKACDLWSVGVITYMLLCGYPPFEGLTDADIIAQVRTGHYKFHREAWEPVSPSAKHFVRHLLDPDPATRFSVVKALRHPWVRNRGVVRLDRMREETINRLICYYQNHIVRKAAMLSLAFHVDPADVRSLLDIFQALDLNGDGRLTRTEFAKGILNCGVEEEVVSEMMMSVDADMSGIIDWCEFLAATLDKSVYYNNHAVMLRAFRSFDQDDSGEILAEELVSTLDITNKEEVDALQEAFDAVDLNGDGALDYREFYAMLGNEAEYARDDMGSARSADNRSSPRSAGASPRSGINSARADGRSPRLGSASPKGRKKGLSSARLARSTTSLASGRSSSSLKARRKRGTDAEDEPGKVDDTEEEEIKISDKEEESDALGRTESEIKSPEVEDPYM